MNPFSMEETRKRKRKGRSLLDFGNLTDKQQLEGMYKGQEGEPESITKARNQFRALVKKRKENEKRMAPKAPKKKYGE